MEHITGTKLVFNRISPTNIRDVEINYENPLKSAEIYI
jgi:hypothetical protein